MSLTNLQIEITWMLDLAYISQMAYKDDIVAEGKYEDTEIATADSDRKIQAKYGNIGL